MQYKIRFLILLFVITFLARTLFISTIPNVLSFDEPVYDDIATNILSGKGFTFSFSAYHVTIPGEPTSFQEPVYPYFLALLKILFGADSYVLQRIAQAFICSLVSVIGALIAMSLFGTLEGIITGVILAVYPPVIYFSRYLMTENIYILFLVAAVLFNIKGLKEQRHRKLRLFLSGLLLGVSTLTRSISLYFLPIAVLVSAVILLREKQRHFLSALYVLLGAVITILPWTVRNTLVHDQFVLLSTKGGWNLYFYNYPIENYQFNERYDLVPIPNLDGYSEPERENYFRKKGTEFILSNPGLILKFAAVKFVDFWNPILEKENIKFSIINLLTFGIITLLAFAGLAVNIHRRHLYHPFLVLWALIFYYNLQALAFTGGGKARLPIEPMLIILASEPLAKILFSMISRLKKRLPDQLLFLRGHQHAHEKK